jgi:uncharacterized membrane protein YfcA
MRGVTLLLLIVLFAAAGVAIGMLGGGGSVLAVPILVYVARLEPRSAIATSLLVVGMTSAIAAARYVRKGEVDLRAAVAVGVPSMIGAFAGGKLAARLPAGLLLAGFTVLMAVTAVVMLRRRADAPCLASRPSSHIAAVGLVVGVVTGLVGAGGGFVLVPALTLLCGMPMRRAIGTSLLVISANAIAGLVAASGAATFDVGLTVAATTAAIAGSLVGFVVGARLAVAKLRAGFGVLVLLIAATMAWEQVPQGFFAAHSAALAAVGALAVALVALGASIVHVRRSSARRTLGAGARATT